MSCVTASPNLLDFPSVNSIWQVEINWKNCANTLDRVISSTYVHTQSHMIQQMSCISLIKADNKDKPDVIDRCAQK